jgi:hypothetical protein
LHHSDDENNCGGVGDDLQRNLEADAVALEDSRLNAAGDALHADVLVALQDCVASALIDRDVVSLATMIVVRRLLVKGWRQGDESPRKDGET